MENTNNGTVTISLARYKELEALEIELSKFKTHFKELLALKSESLNFKLQNYEMYIESINALAKQQRDVVELIDSLTNLDFNFLNSK